MRSAKGGLKVVERFLVREIQYRESQSHLRAFRAEKIVCAGTKIKKVTWCDAGRIMVIVRCAIAWDTDAQHAAIGLAAGRNRLCWGRERAAAEETDLRLLVCRESQRRKEIRNCS